MILYFFSFNATLPTAIYTLSLHDAFPISVGLIMHHFHRIDIWINNAGHGLLDSVESMRMDNCREMFDTNFFGTVEARSEDTRLNSSHVKISYAVFCLKKKKK